jgi:hypothetical protein
MATKAAGGRCVPPYDRDALWADTTDTNSNSSNNRGVFRTIITTLGQVGGIKAGLIVMEAGEKRGLRVGKRSMSYERRRGT